MPNTPALIRAAVTGLYALADVNEEEKNYAETILARWAPCFGVIGKNCWMRLRPSPAVVRLMYFISSRQCRKRDEN